VVRQSLIATGRPAVVAPRKAAEDAVTNIDGTQFTGGETRNSRAVPSAPGADNRQKIQDKLPINP
jgi:hypothetical protein